MTKPVANKAESRYGPEMNKPKPGPLQGLLRASRLGRYRLKATTPVARRTSCMGDGGTRVCCLLRGVRAVATPETLEKCWTTIGRTR
jgi:hypothetical protein